MATRRSPLDEREAASLYEKCVRAARRRGATPDEAHDLASEAFEYCTQAGDWRVGLAVNNVRFRWLDRLKATRRLVAFDAETHEPPPRLWEPALQELRLEVRDVLAAMTRLNYKYRRAIQLHALGYEYDEIAADLGVTQREASGLVPHARMLLRRHMEIERDPLKRFVGIQRRGRRWLAVAKKENKSSVYIGSFSTASQAAAAYDDYVRALGPSSRKLNFPDAAEAARSKMKAA